MLQLTLRTNDGEEFSVDKDILCHSHLFKNMLIDLGIDGDKPSVEPLTLTAVNGWTLQKIIDWNVTHKDLPFRELGEDENPRVELTEEDEALLDVTDEQLLDILYCANYLDLPDLVDAVTQKIANMTEKLSSEQIEQLFGLKHDEGEEEKGLQWYDSCDVSPF